jgi:hypothetical protein
VSTMLRQTDEQTALIVDLRWYLQRNRKAGARLDAHSHCAWIRFRAYVNCPSIKLHPTLGVGFVTRTVAAIIVISVTFAAALAPVRPILAKPTIFRIGLAHLVDLIAEGCGPGWHWSNRRGWNWGHCVLDRRSMWE